MIKMGLSISKSSNNKASHSPMNFYITLEEIYWKLTTMNKSRLKTQKQK